MAPRLDRPAWRPVLEGTTAAAARDAIGAVARELGESAGESRRSADLAVFWAYVAGPFDDAWTQERYDEATVALAKAVATGYPWAGLFGGASGAGWALAHISDQGAADEILEAVDAALVGLLDVERWTADYDLIGGLVGYGVYFLERVANSPAPAARRGLARVVDHLLAASERSEDGLAWLTAPERLSADQRERSPGGYFNCEIGRAHV